MKTFARLNTFTAAVDAVFVPPLLLWKTTQSWWYNSAQFWLPGPHVVIQLCALWQSNVLHGTLKNLSVCCAGGYCQNVCCTQVGISKMYFVKCISNVFYTQLDIGKMYFVHTCKWILAHLKRGGTPPPHPSEKPTWSQAHHGQTSHSTIHWTIHCLCLCLCSIYQKSPPGHRLIMVRLVIDHSLSMSIQSWPWSHAEGKKACILLMADIVGENFWNCTLSLRGGVISKYNVWTWNRECPSKML